MNGSDPNSNALVDIDSADILMAMKKLTKLIQSDKQLETQNYQDTLNSQPNHHFSSPAYFHPQAQQNYMPAPQSQSHPHYNDGELLESLKNIANEISTYEARGDNSQDFLNRTGGNFGNNTMLNSQFGTYEQEKKLDRTSKTINRLYDLENKKREKLAAMQFQKYKQELSTLKSKPEISLNSKIIAQNKGKQPIHERSYAIMKQREENINRMRQELEDMRGEMSTSPTFQPDLSFTKRYHHERSRTPTEFTNQVYAWQRRKEETIQREQYENITRELAELTFKPKINSKSRSIALKNNPGEPVERRLQNHKDNFEEKRQKKFEQSKPSFKPILNEKSQSLMKHRKFELDDNASRQGRSNNASFTNSSFTMDNGRSKTPTQSRVYTQVRTPTQTRTPPKNSVKREKVSPSPRPEKSPRFNEVQYTPALNFILRKLA